MGAEDDAMPSGNTVRNYGTPVYPAAGAPNSSNYDASTMKLFEAQRPITMKKEPLDDTRNDSGVTSESDCPSRSPDSIGSADHSRMSPTQNNIYFPNGILGGHGYNWSQASTSQPNPKGHESEQSNDSTAVTPKSGRNASDNSNGFDFHKVNTTPKFNSHGKMRLYNCKHCEFSTFNKTELWEHSTKHLNSDKILKCPKCAFVTEYKHHWEFHQMNHAGVKPFKCTMCDYACVNKSMLNSHLKSHSKVYQYRCDDCTYETKYYHSLKLHLRKHKHRRTTILNADGTPNPNPVIDIYGTRRGPKVKKQSQSENNLATLPTANNVNPAAQSAAQPMQLNPLMLNPLSQNGLLPFPFPLLPPFLSAVPNQEMLLGVQNFMRERLEELTRQNMAIRRPEPEPQQNGALDLTNKSCHTSENGDDDENMTVAFDNVEVVHNGAADPDHIPEGAAEGIGNASDDSSGEGNNNRYDFACGFCGISFGEEIMFRMHMGYHGYNNPFTCNMCGVSCENKVDFTLHIARVAH